MASLSHKHNTDYIQGDICQPNLIKAGKTTQHMYVPPLRVVKGKQLQHNFDMQVYVKCENLEYSESI